MSKELVTKAEAIRDEVRVGANTAKRVGGILAEISREVNGLYDNVLDWINNEKPVGNGFILTQSDVVNSLEDESELKPLSAKQGMILKAILDALVVDDTTTDDGTKALSARQGKVIADDLRVHNHDSIYQEKGNYATEIHKHPATDVEENSTHRFMTDTERNTLSSLGTTYAKVDLSNATTMNLGQNGYVKFNNGLLIQWGKYDLNSSGYVYFPLSFYDSNYAVTTSNVLSPSESALVSESIIGKSSSYIRVFAKLVSGGVSLASCGLYWTTLGRWK